METGYRLYRGQSLNYIEDPFVPTARRKKDPCNCVKYMEDKIKKINPDFDFIGAKTYQGYRKYIPTHKSNFSEAWYCYFLSLVNASLMINSNSVLRDCVSFDLFKKNIGATNAEILNNCFKYSKYDFEDPADYGSDFNKVINSIVDYSLMQHFNHPFSRIGKKVKFPTMLMDWSQDEEIANRMNSGMIISVNVGWISSGVTPWMNYRTRPYSNTNQLMEEQQGWCFFWPWDYTIKELLEENKNGSGLGADLDIRIESLSIKDKKLCEVYKHRGFIDLLINSTNKTGLIEDIYKRIKDK